MWYTFFFVFWIDWLRVIDFFLVFFFLIVIRYFDEFVLGHLTVTWRLQNQYFPSMNSVHISSWPIVQLQQTVPGVGGIFTTFASYFETVISWFYFETVISWFYFETVILWSYFESLIFFRIFWNHLFFQSYVDIIIFSVMFSNRDCSNIFWNSHFSLIIFESQLFVVFKKCYFLGMFSNQHCFCHSCLTVT